MELSDTEKNKQWEWSSSFSINDIGTVSLQIKKKGVLENTLRSRKLIRVNKKIIDVLTYIYLIISLFYSLPRLSSLKMKGKTLIIESKMELSSLKSALCKKASISTEKDSSFCRTKTCLLPLLIPRNLTF